MAMDPQMMAAMLMQGGQPQSVGPQVPKPTLGGTAMQGGNDFLKMMMLRQMMQQQKNPQNPPAQTPPPINQNPMIPPPQQPTPLQSI